MTKGPTEQTITPKMREALLAAGQKVHFAPGEILREKGAFAPDLLLILSGTADCILSDAGDVHFTLGPDTILGEIGFLTGKGATATLRAVGPIEAVSLDATAFARLRQNTPDAAADVLRHMARTMSDRAQQNVALLEGNDPSIATGLEVIRCSTLDQLRSAQRLRYDIYCIEQGRTSPLADIEEGTLVDDLDAEGTSFIALEGGLAVGTARVNLACDTALDDLRGRYHVGAPPFATSESSIVTQSAIRDSHRSGEVLAELLGAIATFLRASEVRFLFVDCAPEASESYAELGFYRAADDFTHGDCGARRPMVLDLDTKAKALVPKR